MDFTIKKSLGDKRKKSIKMFLPAFFGVMFLIGNIVSIPGFTLDQASYAQSNNRHNVFNLGNNHDHDQNPNQGFTGTRSSFENNQNQNQGNGNTVFNSNPSFGGQQQSQNSNPASPILNGLHTIGVDSPALGIPFSGSRSFSNVIPASSSSPISGSLTTTTQQSSLCSTIKGTAFASLSSTYCNPSKAASDPPTYTYSQTLTNGKTITSGHTHSRFHVVGPDNFKFINSYWTTSEVTRAIDVGTSANTTYLSAASHLSNIPIETDNGYGPVTLAVELQYEGVVQLTGITAALKLPPGFVSNLPLIHDPHRYDISFSNYRGHIYPGQGITLYFQVTIIGNPGVRVPYQMPLAIHFLREDKQIDTHSLTANQQDLFASALSVKNVVSTTGTGTTGTGTTGTGTTGTGTTGTGTTGTGTTGTGTTGTGTTGTGTTGTGTTGTGTTGTGTTGTGTTGTGTTGTGTTGTTSAATTSAATTSICTAPSSCTATYNNNIALNRNFGAVDEALHPYDFVNQVLPIEFAITGQELFSVLIGAGPDGAVPLTPILALLPPGVPTPIKVIIRNTGDAPIYNLNAAPNVRDESAIAATVVPSPVNIPNVVQQNALEPLVLIGPQSKQIGYLPVNGTAELDITVVPSFYVGGSVEPIFITLAYNNQVGLPTTIIKRIGVEILPVDAQTALANAVRVPHQISDNVINLPNAISTNALHIFSKDIGRQIAHSGPVVTHPTTGNGAGTAGGTGTGAELRHHGVAGHNNAQRGTGTSNGANSANSANSGASNAGGTSSAASASGGAAGAGGAGSGGAGSGGAGAGSGGGAGGGAGGGGGGGGGGA